MPYCMYITSAEDIYITSAVRVGIYYYQYYTVEDRAVGVECIASPLRSDH